MENVLDNPSAIKDELDELNTMWEDVCNKSTLKLARLMEAMKVSVQSPHNQSIFLNLGSIFS